MDKEVLEMKECLVRVDERTARILEVQEKQADSLNAHEERDREDFKEVHGRINKLERRQNWFMGIGTGVVTIITAGWAILKQTFGG
jgi:hypothetical protein